ncbi:MAG: NAD(P)-dependent oxidoreductase [Phycisphaerae bacterium]
MLRILLVESLNPAAEARLAAHAEVRRAPAGDDSVLCEAIRDCDAAIVRTSCAVSARVLAAGRPRLCVVGVAGVGTDRVDLAAANALGVVVLNRAAAASAAVAEFTLALILNLLRPVHALARRGRGAGFDAARAVAHGVELRGLTVGVVGMGRIGSRVARLCAEGFHADVLFYDVAPVGPFNFAATSVDPARLWSTSDIVTLHTPLTEITRRMVDERLLRTVKSSARLINTARGAIVDTAALVDALREGRLGGAALDVTDPEPLPADHAFHEMPNVIVTPHVAARTHAGVEGMFGIADDVLAFLRDRS